MYRASQRASRGVQEDSAVSLSTFGFESIRACLEDVAHIIGENELHFLADRLR